MPRRWRYFAALLLAALALLFVAHRCARSAPAPTASAASATGPAAPAWAPPKVWKEAPLQVPRSSAATSGISFIEQIRVDRTEVCANEPVLVEVDARDGRESHGSLRLMIGHRAGGRRGVVAFGVPGEQTLTVRAIADDKAIDSRVVKIQVHDCGGAFQFVHVRTEAAEGPDTYRFIATPFFDRPECASLTGPDGGRPSPAELTHCHAAPEPGERLTYRWEFGDGAGTSSDTHVVTHSYADRVQDEIETNAIVRVTVASTVHGTIEGFINVLMRNVSAANKQQVGVITPTVVLGARLPGESRALVWDAVVHNSDRQTLSFDEVEISLSTCEGGEGKTRREPARRVVGQTSFPTGKTKTHAQLAAADVGPDDCFVSFNATGTAPDGHQVAAVFGARVNRDPKGVSLGPDETDPALKKRYQRTIKALAILGRGADGGPATVTDDEIRELQLKGLLD